MSVPTGPITARYEGDGVQTEFPIPFPFWGDDGLAAYLIGADGAPVPTTAFTITGGGGGIGTLTMLTAPAVGTDLLIALALPLEQQQDFAAIKGYPAAAVNRGMDKAVSLIKQVAEETGRSIRLPVGDTSDATLPPAPARAGKLPAFDKATGTLTLTDANELSQEVQDIIADDLAASQAARAGAEAARDIAVAAKDTAVSSAAAAGVSEGNALASENAAKASENAASASESAAAASAAAALTSETAAKTSEENAAASAQSAADTAATIGDIDEALDEAAQHAADAEAAKAAAQAAQGAAESARDDAQSYAGDAQTSASDASNSAANANASENSAADARDTALGARNAAQTAQGAAESARNTAITARNEALSAATNAASSATAAQNQANRSQNQADRAQGYADNLEALSTSLSYRGEHNGTSAPAGATRGYFWVIGSTGAGATWGGITWAVGDAALYNGSAWQRVALDWLLAQADANIAALRKEVNFTKDPMGGISTTQAGGVICGSLTPNTIAAGGANSFSLAWGGKVTAVGSNFYGCLIGSIRGVIGFNVGGFGIAVGNATATGTAVAAYENDGTATRIDSNVSILGRIAHIVLTFDTTTKEAALYVDGELKGTGNWTAATLNGGNAIALMHAINNSGGIDVTRSAAGDVYSATVFSRALSALEVAALAETCGRTIPLTARSNIIAHYACDEGIGYQTQDRSGNQQPGRLSASGCTHLIPTRNAWLVSDRRATTGWIYGADRECLPTGHVKREAIGVNHTGSPVTVSLGTDALTPANLVASATIPANGTLAMTWASRFITGRKLHLTTSGDVTIIVEGFAI